MKLMNPQTILIPPKSVEPSPEISEAAWLGKCVENFKIAARGFKGGQYND